VSKKQTNNVQVHPSIGLRLFTSNMYRLPLSAIIVLVSLLVTVMVVLVVGTVYAVSYS
jgi:hypothetical protein